MVYSQRSVLLRANEQEIDPFQLNPIAKTLFDVAGVTFEVCALHLCYLEIELRWRLEQPTGMGGPRSCIDYLFTISRLENVNTIVMTMTINTQ